MRRRAMAGTIAGLVGVGGVLLLRLAEVSDADLLEILQDIARRFGEDRG
jgi:hypothetical protein